MIYFTFGTESPYSRCYVGVDTDDREIARGAMFLAHSNKWAFDYTETEIKNLIKKFNLRPLAIFRLNQYRRWEAE